VYQALPSTELGSIGEFTEEPDEEATLPLRKRAIVALQSLARHSYVEDRLSKKLRKWWKACICTSMHDQLYRKKNAIIKLQKNH